MDALVKAALDKVNQSVEAIFELKESDYPELADLRLGMGKPNKADLSEFKERITYSDAVSDTIAKAIKTVDALRFALRAL